MFLRNIEHDNGDFGSEDKNLLIINEYIYYVLNNEFE